MFNNVSYSSVLVWDEYEKLRKYCTVELSYFVELGQFICLGIKTKMSSFENIDEEENLNFNHPILRTFIEKLRLLCIPEYNRKRRSLCNYCFHKIYCCKNIHQPFNMIIFIYS